MDGPLISLGWGRGPHRPLKRWKSHAGEELVGPHRAVPEIEPEHNSGESLGRFGRVLGPFAFAFLVAAARWVVG